MYLKIGFGIAACAVLAACGRTEPPATVSAAAAAPADWRRVATDADRERLRVWRRAWVEALAKARGSGNGKAIAAEGVLFEPDRALDVAMPPEGRYKCRMFKLGGRGTAMQDFTAYPYFECRVVAEGDVYSIYKSSGSQRPVDL
jgi:hypothetical protein